MTKRHLYKWRGNAKSRDTSQGSKDIEERLPPQSVTQWWPYRSEHSWQQLQLQNFFIPVASHLEAMGVKLLNGTTSPLKSKLWDPCPSSLCAVEVGRAAVHQRATGLSIRNTRKHQLTRNLSRRQLSVCVGPSTAAEKIVNTEMKENFEQAKPRAGSKGYFLHFIFNTTNRDQA